jgi:hypothetical protein
MDKEHLAIGAGGVAFAILDAALRAVHGARVQYKREES